MRSLLGIPSAEAVGTHMVLRNDAQLITAPTSIVSAEAISTHKLNLKVEPASVASTEAVGSPTVTT